MQAPGQNGGTTVLCRLALVLVVYNEATQRPFEPLVGCTQPEEMILVERIMPEDASRAFENQPARRDVPETDAAFDVSIEPTRGHVGHRKGSGTHHAEFANVSGQVLHCRHHELDVLRAFGEPKRDVGCGSGRPAWVQVFRPSFHFGATVE